MIVKGWQLYAHPLFSAQLERLTEAVAREHKPSGAQTGATANAKVLASLRHLVFETIPADPTRPDYRQGSTLGAGHKHWFRAKFGNQRFRLFFRYSASAKIIIFAWVNDQQTLRTYGSRSDAYAVFRKMLEKGNPPDDWDGLLKGSSRIRSGSG